jgi:hypothetical protein
VDVWPADLDSFPTVAAALRESGMCRRPGNTRNRYTHTHTHTHIALIHELYRRQPWQRHSTSYAAI